MRVRAKWVILGAVAILLFAGVVRSDALAEVKPGDFITPDNAAKVKDLVAPGVYYKVERGMSMKIVPTTRIEWPPPYKEATEKYSGQVRLSDDRRTVVGYVAGQPFPLLDPNDPDVATKIMWNNVFRPITSDDYDLRFYDCDSVYVQKGQAQTGQLEYFQIGHYAGYSLVGRTEVEPMPIDPDFKNSNRYWLFGLYPLLAPAEIRGVGFLRYRYADPMKADDVWAWIPKSRRIRRLNESILSSSTAPGTSVHAWDPDHYSGFNAKIEQYDYKLLGEKRMLAVVNALHSPSVRCPTDNGASTCPEAWEMRQMYIVSAKPRRGIGAQTIGEAIHSDTLIYIESEVWFPPYIDTYDRRGELFQNHIYWLAHRDRPVPDARVAIYPFKRAFVVSAVSTDVQSGLATMCYLPGIETPERECWYINMGAVDKDFFTVLALTNAAQAGH
jgi:hypothetical protein